MLRMTLQARRGAGVALAFMALGAVGRVAPVEAQQVRPRVRVVNEDCRCVDRDGNPIEHCTCFTTPDIEGVYGGLFSLREARPRLGITIAEGLDADDASLGARVESVLDDGPADEAGLEKGDIITALDGKSLLRPLDDEAEKDFDLDGSMAVQRLMELIRSVEPGQEVRVDYLRDGASHTTTVKARELDSWGVSMVLPRWRGSTGEMAEAMGDLRTRLQELRSEGLAPRVLEVLPPEAPNAPRGSWRIRSPSVFYSGAGECPSGSVTLAAFSTRCVGGVSLESLNPKLGEYFGTDHGVLVTDVGDDSNLGLEPGDVILAVGDREATDPDRVRRILTSYGDDEAVTFRIMRQKREMSVQGNLAR